MKLKELMTVIDNDIRLDFYELRFIKGEYGWHVWEKWQYEYKYSMYKKEISSEMMEREVKSIHGVDDNCIYVYLGR